MDFIHRPIGQWPGPLTTQRKRAPFRAGYNDTLKLLDAELRYLAARDVVLQVALVERDIRQDGKPRADARPLHPGVILSFRSKFGPLSYPCDRFDDWTDNLRAIALSLQHLRAVDRYGVTKRGEQYRGWTPLPDKTNDSLPATVAEAAIVLASLSGLEPGRIVRSREVAADAYRAAAKKTHPDRGGDPADFRRVQAAKEVLDKVFG